MLPCPDVSQKSPFLLMWNILNIMLSFMILPKNFKYRVGSFTHIPAWISKTIIQWPKRRSRLYFPVPSSHRIGTDAYSSPWLGELVRDGTWSFWARGFTPHGVRIATQTGVRSSRVFPFTDRLQTPSSKVCRRFLLSFLNQSNHTNSIVDKVGKFSCKFYNRSEV